MSSQNNRQDTVPRPEYPGRRALVLGGGIAGLLAARVLADHFDRVVILERDRYPEGPELRAGAPQARHVHLLLLRGKRILERLFPGLSGELTDHGAETVNMGDELAVLTYYGWRVRYRGDLSLLTFTQPLLEWSIRRRLDESETVKTVEGCRVTGFMGDGQMKRITGVRGRFPDGSNGEVPLHGDFVVDATGRFSRTPVWLSELGYEPPEETVVDPFLGYASRIYERPGESGTERRDWKALLLLGKPPNRTRGGVLLPVEDNRWHVTLVGVGKDYPPNEVDGFLEFARSLRSSVLYDAIREARPLSPVAGFQATRNRRRHYESLPRWPKGFAVLGDALCALNPIYAQGISVAALEAGFLDRCLHNLPTGSTTGDGAAQSFQRNVTEVIETPWRMATTDDLRWPATEGGRSGLLPRLALRYLDAVIGLATEYPEVDRRYAGVAHLIDPPRALFHPGISIRAFARLLNPLRYSG